MSAKVASPAAPVAPVAPVGIPNVKSREAELDEPELTTAAVAANCISCNRVNSDSCRRSSSTYVTRP